MKLLFNRRNLVKALHRLSSVGYKLELHPFFGSVLLIARDAKTGITICQEIQPEEGTLDDVVGCELYPLKNYLANVEGESVSFSIGNRLSIKVADMSPIYLAREVGASRFGQYEDVPDVLSAVDSQDFIGLTKVSIVGNENATGFQSAVFLRLGSDKLDVFCTDGFSMAHAWAKKSSEHWNGEDIVLPVPVNIMASLHKMYWEGEITIGYAEGRVFFNCEEDGFWLYSPLVKIDKAADFIEKIELLFESKSAQYVYVDPIQLKTWIGLCGGMSTSTEFFAIAIAYDGVDSSVHIANTDNQRGLVQHKFLSMGGGAESFDVLVGPKLAQQGQGLIDAIANDITGIKLTDSAGQGHVLFMSADGANVQFALAKMVKPK